MRERFRPRYWLERLSLKRDRDKTSRSAEDIGRLAAEFDTIFENAALGIVITDEIGRFVRTNRAYERFLGYEKGELIGRSARRVTHPDHYPHDVQMFGEMTRGERASYQVDKRYIRQDGSIVWGRLTAFVVRPQHTSSPFFMGLVEDIHERRQIAEQLRESEQRLQLYIDRAPLACIVWDAQQSVRVWNPAAERMFGYTAGEAIGRNIYDLTSTPEGLRAIEPIRRAARAGQPHADNLVVENRRKDGSRVQSHWHYTIVRDASGAIDAVIAFAIDISARLRAEEERGLLESQLRQAQKMQSLGTLAGGIAHDFNNLLLAISGNTRLATEDLAPDHPAQISLAEVAKASTRAAAVVNQILAFSRHEESPRSSVDLHSIIEESTSLLRAALGPRIALRTKLMSELIPERPIVLGDPAQIHQVLVNLATNAAHAMSERGGELSIELDVATIDSARTLHLGELPPGQYYRLSVRDAGSGIRPEMLERIFEPFFTTKPRGQGTGLGLAVVHGIVKGHDGAIDVETKAGAGSTFHVYLPVFDGEAMVTESVPSAQRGQGQRILYVDDEESLVYLITRVLTRLDYEVVGCTDAHVALAEFRREPSRFDAVVTDLSMPKLSGLEFAREVLRLAPHIPVVLTSGYVRTDDREAALQAGVHELVLKPNTVEELGEVLHRLLSQRPTGQLAMSELARVEGTSGSPI